MDAETEEILEELERIGAMRDGFIDEREAAKVRKKFSEAVVNMVISDWNQTSGEISRAIDGIQDLAVDGAVWAARGSGRLAKRGAIVTGKFLWKTTKAGMKEAMFGSEEPAQKGGRR